MLAFHWCACTQNVIFSSIIWNHVNSFNFYFSEIMEYQATEISKESSKEMETSKQTPQKSSLQTMVVSKLDYISL